VNSNSSTQRALSQEQQELISDVLSEYDSSSLTSEDASEIVSAFSEAGITPSKELANYMDSLGFDAKEVGELGGARPPQAMGSMPPPPPPPPKDDTVSALEELLSASSDEDDEDSTTTSSDFSELLLDYTSKIVNLNEKSQEKVQEILDKYSPENSEYSRQDSSKLALIGLGEILKDSSNYNSTVVYA
jgi:hypothetical protein